MKIKFGLGIVFGYCLMMGNVWALSDENRPEYQKEYDAYLQDLEVIAQTGKAPSNPLLEADLAKMASNRKILLTASSQLVNRAVQESGERISISHSLEKSETDKIYAQESAKVLNSIEMLRVPEEFREEYENLYKEDNKTISGESLVQENAEPNPSISEEGKEVPSEHKNPFQPVKEKKEVVEEETVVDAYFNPFGRPFVAQDSSETVDSLYSEEKKTSSGVDDARNAPRILETEVSENNPQPQYLSPNQSKNRKSHSTSRGRSSVGKGLNIRESMIVD